MKNIKSNSSISFSDKGGLERLIFFSDAVFAIAMTLLALEIRLPELSHPVSESQLFLGLLSIWPKYLGYFVSFLVIGTFWIGHHRKFRYIKRYDTGLMYINLLLLLLVSFLPFPTTILSEYGNRTAIIFYSLSVTGGGFLFSALWMYSSYNHRLLDKTLSQIIVRRELLRTLVTPAIFLLSIGLAYINLNLAMFSWISIAFLFFLI